MAPITITEMSVEDIHKALSQENSAIQLYQEAIDKGVRFGHYLERLNPTQKGDTLDAFGRQLRAAGIVVESNRYAGYWASEGGAFVDSVAGRALFMEFFARNWQQVMDSNRAQQAEIAQRSILAQRAILLSSDSEIGSWDRPYADATGPRWRNRIAPPIPLSELVAVTTPITGEVYRSIYMEYDAEAVRMFRVGESAEIPMTKLVSSGNVITLRKYGRGLQATYEQLRRNRVDKIAWWIQWVALQAQIDKVAAVIDTAINGDGNPNTAATEYNMLTLDSTATPGELTHLAWLLFQMQFGEAYAMTTALAQMIDAAQVLLLNVGTANIPLAGYELGGISTRIRVINRTADGLSLGYTNEAPTKKILGMDASMAIEHVVEIGSTIREAERTITNQTQTMVMTEVEGFGVLDPAASKLLDLNE